MNKRQKKKNKKYKERFTLMKTTFSNMIKDKESKEYCMLKGKRIMKGKYDR